MNSKFVLYIIVAAMGTIIFGAGTGTTILQAYAQGRDDVWAPAEAPTVISGNHVYIVWFTNEGTVHSNYEVGFRASNDSGATFGPIANLSDTANSDSINAEISAEGKNVIVSWWEQNQTSMLPFARVSTDGGQTFGERLNITANSLGTIGRAEGK